MRTRIKNPTEVLVTLIKNPATIVPNSEIVRGLRESSLSITVGDNSVLVYEGGMLTAQICMDDRYRITLEDLEKSLQRSSWAF